MNLVVETNPKSVVDVTMDYGESAVLFTPSIDENFWVLRVKVSPNQAVVAFPKMETMGIGFQYEDVDWNSNLPHLVDAEDIWEHISSNSRGAEKATCIEAIKLLQKEVLDRKLSVDKLTEEEIEGLRQQLRDIKKFVDMYRVEQERKGKEVPANIELTSPSSGFKYGTSCKDCNKSLPRSDPDERYETLSRRDNGPVLLCHECYLNRGNDVR